MQALPAGSGLRSQLALFTMPESPAAVDVAAISVPARGFTGDFYFTHRHGERLWFALGDVAGKGINAAVVMAMIQEELEQRIGSCARTGCDPASTMTRLHEFLRTVLPPSKFATAVIGHLHDDGRLIIANAGHCPPLILRRNRLVQEIGSTGPVTGILPHAQWHSAEVTLAPGESLILYSDGVLEAHSANGEEFGVEGIKRALRDGEDNSARAIADAVLASLNRHRVIEREDDLTLVILRR